MENGKIENNFSGDSAIKNSQERFRSASIIFLIFQFSGVLVLFLFLGLLFLFNDDPMGRHISSYRRNLEFISVIFVISLIVILSLVMFRKKKYIISMILATLLIAPPAFWILENLSKSSIFFLVLVALALWIVYGAISRRKNRFRDKGSAVLTTIMVLFVATSFSGLAYFYLHKNKETVKNNSTWQEEAYSTGVKTAEVKVYHVGNKDSGQSSQADPKMYWKEIIDKGDVDVIKRYLEKGGDIEYVINDYNGQRPLMMAAAFGKNEVVAVLLDSGAKIESVDKDGSTALFYASAKGQTDTANFLIGRGANPDAFSKSDVTPLYEAASWGTSADVKVLLDAGANIEGHGKKPPLYIAVLKGNADIVKLLIERGANVNVIHSLDSSNSTGMTPLEGARVTNNNEIEAILIAAGAK